jgi:hypothetical protein
MSLHCAADGAILCLLFATVRSVAYLAMHSSKAPAASMHVCSSGRAVLMWVLIKPGEARGGAVPGRRLASNRSHVSWSRPLHDLIRSSPTARRAWIFCRRVSLLDPIGWHASLHNAPGVVVCAACIVLPACLGKGVITCDSPCCDSAIFRSNGACGTSTEWHPALSALLVARHGHWLFRAGLGVLCGRLAYACAQERVVDCVEHVTDGPQSTGCVGEN